ncbi:MAG: 1-deoxy-D-xylulose-5-phosphate synthase [Phycisphaeraceae bacterium]
MADTLLSSIRSPADLKKLAIDQLPQLAEEMRQAICQAVSKSGGHLAPNLGVVELTIAMHYVFDFGHDRLLFDVGHQCYPHKLLTGRLPMLAKLRQRDGMAGFPEPRESPFDLFSVGHAGTAISTAVGMARGDLINGQADRKTVAIIGDASIVNGIAMEGLNNAGTLKRQFLVVLNDNGMSIAKPQGAMAQYFDRIRVSPAVEQLRKRAHEIMQRMPYGREIEGLSHRAGEAVRHAIHPGHMFEQFGLVCVGPVDGHDLPTLVDMFNQLRDLDYPVLLHAKTIKGKGFDFATCDPTKFHSPSPFMVEGCRVEMKKSGRAFTSAYADIMIDLMKQDEKIVSVTAAMPDGTGLSKVMPLFPERTFDTGICESHAMDMCAGMAKAGLKPFFAVYSTFAQRAIDQVFQEVTLQGLPVRLCLDRAGFVGDDGAVHHGFMDVAMFASLPGIVLTAASDEPNLRAVLEFMRTHDAGASVTRYPRANVPEKPLQSEVPAFELGKANFIYRTGGASDPVSQIRNPKSEIRTSPLAILAYGTEVYDAHEAIVNELESQGYDVALYDARFAKPVDIELVQTLVEAGIPVLTVEDHALRGGFGACVLEACNDRHIPTDLIHRLAMPERWIYQASRKAQLAETGLDAAGIARRVREILDRPVPATPEVHVTIGERVKASR